VWWVNTTRLHGLDGTSATDLTTAELEGRRQVVTLMRFFRRYFPGAGNAVLLETAAQIGVRETRRIIGEYVLTLDDLQTGRHFPDVVALGGFPVDIHSPTDDTGGVTPEYRTAAVYEIPYRTLVPVDTDQLLAAGRCLSAQHVAIGAVRAMPTCFATGQSAGVAAAIAAEEETPPRGVDYQRLRDRLEQQGAILSV
jgi:hypothetical protein